MNELEQLEQILGADLMKEVPSIVKSVTGQADGEEQQDQDSGPRLLKTATVKADREQAAEPRILSVDVMYDERQKKLLGNVWFLASPRTEYAFIKVTMLHKGRVIAANTFADIRPDTLELHVVGTPSGPVAAEDIAIRVDASAKTRDGSLKSLNNTYSVDFLLGMDDAVDSVDVKDPRNIRTPVGNTIHVSFDRRSQLMNMIDYDYTDYRVTRGDQPIYLDMNGVINLKEGYEYIENSYRTEKIFVRKGTDFFEYKNGEAAITYNKSQRTIAYSYNHKWENVFPKSVYQASIEADYRLLASFQYRRLSDAKSFTGTIIVSSRDYFYMNDKDGWQPTNYRKIPNILFYWGCMEENTPVTMEDGSTRKVKDIRIGDRVRSVDGQGCTVRNIMRGTEEKLISISTVNGREILVTADHPFLTNHGEKAAADLVYTDQIRMEDGSFQSIEGAYPVEKHFVVYSLEIEPSAYIFGSGMAIGDWQHQGNMKKDRLEEDRFPMEEEITAECQKINDRLYQTYERG